MRQIGTIPDEAKARRLADYLLTHDITTRLDPSPEGWVIWVHREEKVEAARREMEDFLLEPDSPRFQGVEKTAAQKRREAKRVERQHLKNTINLRGRLGYRSPERCPLTMGLIGISVAVAVVTWFGSAQSIVDWLYIASYQILPAEGMPTGVGAARGAVVGGAWVRSDLLADLRHGEVWRLLTPIFLHFHPLHLLFNMFWLYDLGGMIELRRGTKWLAMLVLVTGITSNVGQYLSTNLPFFGGMSGVVLGLFGYVWMKGIYAPEQGMGLSRNTVIFMLLYLAFTSAGGISGIANGAHLVGLISGVLIGVAPHLFGGFHSD